MKRSGSSLILVTIIAATIVIVAVGASRLGLVHFSQSQADEDKMAAYYAAKAGIEDGLIRYRHNPDVETQESKVYSFDLTSGRVNPSGDDRFEVAEGSIRQMWDDFDPTHQYYDLKINFRNTQVGNVADIDASTTLNKDDTLQLTGFPNTTTPYYLHYIFKWDPACPVATSLVQLQQIREAAGSQVLAYEQVTAKMSQANAYNSATLSNLIIRVNPGAGDEGELTNYVRIRAFGCSVKYAFETVSSATGVSGAGAIKLDALKTYLTATGYYGSVKRTLVAEINRQTGRLISVYDFNLYAGQGNIQP